MTKKRIARWLHKIAWKLAPIEVATRLVARPTDMPMTDASASVLADLLAREFGHPVEVEFMRVDGSPGSQSGSPRAN